MEHKLFKPKDFEEGRHAVVGDCNGIPMAERWKVETPLFAKAILSNLAGTKILDYGCGVGRLAKEILIQNKEVYVVGVDASKEMISSSIEYANSSRYSALKPVDLGEEKFDLVYCVYVLQHVPAIEIRGILARIHYHLKEGGTFVYCSSDYRMAIRFDEPGFFDDRFLGVNLREEIERLFKLKGDLFDHETFVKNPILDQMVNGDLKHPAFVYTKREIDKPYFDVRIEKNEGLESHPVGEGIQVESPRLRSDDKKKLLLLNRLAPGDCLVMTNAIRDLHKACPNQFITDVRTPCQEIFENNPYITKLQYNLQEFEKTNMAFSIMDHAKLSPGDRTKMISDVLAIDMNYPMIHSSGESGRHFSEGHRGFLEEVLGIQIPQTSLRPEIYLSQSEKDWPSPATVLHGLTGGYWVINAGSKGDFTLKQYPYYQEVVDLLKDKITLVQIGQKAHKHTLLTGAIDMVGMTNLRELFRLIYHAAGVISCVSLPMHVAAAFKKPCVVVAGAREGTRWELYPNHQFIYVNGCLPCSLYDGCWKSKHSECKYKKNDVPVCMTLIRPEDVAWAVERYYEGGLLEYEDILIQGVV